MAERTKLAALELFDNGYEPVPAVPGDKVLATDGTGRTGYAGVGMTREEVEASPWNGNLAVRLPKSEVGAWVVGLDIDAYHDGLETYRGLSEEVGSRLPKTWVVHSCRNDGSGIRFYRVPNGTKLVSNIPPGIEVIQWFHRYAMVPPSSHPEGRNYAITSPEGERTDVLPPIEDLPALPAAWVERLAALDQDFATPAAGATAADLAEFVADFHFGRPGSGKLDGPRRLLESATEGGRHDAARDAACWMFREVLAGAYPATDAIAVLDEWWGQFDDKGPAELQRIKCWALAQARSDPSRIVEMSEELDQWAVEQRRQADPATAEGIHLPESFWAARPWLGHIHQAALAHGPSPEAVLLATLGRFAASVPAELRLDSGLGTEATLDWLGVVVGPSGGYKSQANAVAKKLLEGLNGRIDVMWDAPVGSGEGLIQAFMGPELDEEGKKTGRQTWTTGEYVAVHTSIDEATALTATADRNGTTIVQTLLTAWSGGTLGNLNATAERRRIVPAGVRRISVTMNMQTKHGWMLMTDELRSRGFANRIAFAFSEPEVEIDWRERPDKPGPLHLPQIPVVPGRTVTFPDATRDAADAQRQAIRRGLVDGDLEGHAVLVQMKIAAMFALVEERYEVTDEDWELAGAVMDSSRATRALALASVGEQERARLEAQGRAQGIREAAAEDTKERQAVARLAEKIRDVVAEEEWAWNKLRRRVTNSRTKDRFGDAVQLAESNGWVEVADASSQGSSGQVVRRLRG